MASKKLKGKLCPYCTLRQSTEADHVFAREFFTNSERANLPKAPSCRECNLRKSELEHYLTTILPFGGRHRDAHENLSELVPPRLRRNARLHKDLQDAVIGVSNPESGLAIPINAEAMSELFEYIVRGLAWVHWKLYFEIGDCIEIGFVTTTRVTLLERSILAMQARDKVHVRLGGDAFAYKAIQLGEDPKLTVWIFTVYGGLIMAEDLSHQNRAPTCLWALTGPMETTKENAALRRSL